MIQLWVLMALVLSLAWLYEHTYFGVNSHSLKKRKFNIPIVCMVILLGGFLGLRTGYNDTKAYISMYENTLPFPGFWDTFDSSLSADPGFTICNDALKTMGTSTQTYLMLYSLVIIGLHIAFIYQNRNSLTLNILLFICVGSYTFAGAAIKQSLATAICLCALPLAVNRKWIPYGLFVFLAGTFHIYALIYLLVPFLMFRPWTKSTLLLLIGTVAVAFSLQNLFGAIIGITSSLGETYTVDSFNGEGVNVFRVIVCNVPMLLALVYHKDIFQNSTRSENLMFNLAMVNGCIMFIGLFGTANYFARLANFFVTAQAVALPWMIHKIPRRNRGFIKIAMIVCYLVYFNYATNVSNGAFSDLFKRITVSEFFDQLF